MNIRVIITALSMLLFATSGFAENCDLLLQKLQSIHPDLPAISTQLKNLKPDLFLGKSIPTWNDFQEIDALILDLKKVLKKLQTSRKMKKLTQLYPDLKTDLDQSELWRSIQAEMPLSEGKLTQYQPTEYELKKLYRNSIQRLNAHLPKDFRFKLPPLPSDPRPAELMNQADELMVNLNEKFNLFFLTTGHQDLIAFRKAMVAQPHSEKLVELIDLLKNEQFELTMRRPENGRWWTPKVGLQNQFVTGSSRGYFTPAGRNNIEAACLGLDRTSYTAFDNELKPKYGSLRPIPGQGHLPNVGEATYGSDIYILKKDKLKKRITFSPGDTNNRATSRKRYPNESGQITSWETANFKVESWDDLFIPWEDRELLAPIFKTSFESDGIFGRPSPPIAEELKVINPTNMNSYTEIQVWGPLTLDDVEAFEFSDNPPTGEFLNELLSRNIKIRDGHMWPPVDWKPPR